MSRIAIGRVIRGGIVAGLVMNVLDYLVNGIALAGAWDDATRTLGVDPPEVAGMSIVGWVASDFVFGVLLVWLYAAIRPRFGPGPRTALLAAVVVWLVAHLAYAALAFTGLYPNGVVIQSAAGALAGWILGGLAGCRLYREASSLPLNADA